MAGFQQQRSTGAASVRSSHKFPRWLMISMPPGSQTDLPLAKAQPINNSGGAYRTTGLRREGSYCTEANCSQRKGEWEYMTGRAMQTPKPVKKKEEALLKRWSRFPRSPKCSPWQGSSAPAAQWRTPCWRRGGVPEAAENPVGSLCWRRLLARLVALWVSQAGAVHSWRIATCGMEAHCSRLLPKDCTMWEGLILE